MSEFQNPVQLLADLVNALDSAHISSWQSTAGWDEQLKAAREYIQQFTDSNPKLKRALHAEENANANVADLLDALEDMLGRYALEAGYMDWKESPGKVFVENRALINKIKGIEA